MPVEWLWAGAQTDDGFRVRGKTDGTAARVAVSTSPDLSSPTYTDATVDPQGVATADVTGLDPWTRYYFAIEVDTVLDTAMPGRIRTAPAEGEPASFTFAAGACTQWDGAAFHRIRKENPDFFIHLGDFTYTDETSLDLQPHRDIFDLVLGTYRWESKLHREVGIVLCVDDHDFGPNDADSTSAGRVQYQEVYREVAPHYTLPSTIEGGWGVWQAFTWGRLRLIVTDLRTERSPKSDEDTADKRMFKAEQEAWFKAELLAAKAAGLGICWVNTIPWIGTTHPYGDRWGSYTTHRQELADFFAANGLGDHMFIVSGDAHLLAIDHGENNQWGGFPVFQFAALNSTGFTQGGPYTTGDRPGLDQYGTIEVQDTGGTTLTVTGRCIAQGDLWAEHTFTLPVPAVGYSPPPSTPTGLVTGDGRRLVIR